MTERTGGNEAAMRYRPWMLTFLVSALMILAGCTADPGMPKNTLPTAEKTVEAYCDLDAHGARLTSDTWSRVLPYISWAEEAGFDRAFVISGFHVVKEQQKGDAESLITVVYQVLGVVSGGYAADRRTETVRFKVARTDRGWKIVEPDALPPHVLAEVMAKHLEATKQDESAEKIRNSK